MATSSRRNCSLLVLFAILSSFIRISMAKVVMVTVHTTVEVTSTVPGTPTVPTPASYTSAHEFRDTVLRVSNEYRKTHEAEGLKWNETLADYSREWAQTCIWKHSDGPYGENLAFGYPNASAAVEAWGDERKYYNFDKPTGFTEKTGHFTQLVWKSTIEVGCAAVNCGYTQDDHKARRDGNGSSASRIAPRELDGSTKAQGWYVVCEYTPAGNVVGDHNEYFKKNVKPGNELSTTTAATSGSQPTRGAAMKTGRHSAVRTTMLALGAVAVGMSLYT